MTPQAESAHKTIIHKSVQKQLAEILDTLDEMNLKLIALEWHELYAAHSDFKTAVTRAEDRSIALFAALKYLAFVEKEVRQKLGQPLRETCTTTKDDAANDDC